MVIHGVESAGTSQISAKNAGQGDRRHGSSPTGRHGKARRPASGARSRSSEGGCALRVLELAVAGGTVHEAHLGEDESELLSKVQKRSDAGPPSLEGGGSPARRVARSAPLEEGTNPENRWSGG